MPTREGGSDNAYKRGRQRHCLQEREAATMPTPLRATLHGTHTHTIQTHTHTLYTPHGTHTHTHTHTPYATRGTPSRTTPPTHAYTSRTTPHTTPTHHTLQGAQPVAGEARVRGSELSWPLLRVWFTLYFHITRYSLTLILHGLKEKLCKEGKKKKRT